MTVCLYSLILMASLASGEPAGIRLAAPDFSVVNLDERLGRFANEHLAQQLGVHGYLVTTPRELVAVLDLERQKQLLDCDDGSTSCLTELAAALGAEGVVLGDLAALGRRMQLNVKVIDGSNGRRVAAWTATVMREEELIAALDRAALELAIQLAPHFGREAPARPPAGSGLASSRPMAKWILGGAGAVAVAGGLVSLGLARGELTAIRALPPTLADAEQHRARGQRFERAGWALGGVGLALGGGAAVLHLRGSAAQVTPSVTVQRGAAALGISGVIR